MNIYIIYLLKVYENLIKKEQIEDNRREKLEVRVLDRPYWGKDLK